MFEFLFRYAPAAYEQGHFVLLAAWPAWICLLLVLLFALGLALQLRRHRGRSRARIAAIWALQTALIALLLFMLWEPALSLAELKPQQNIVAVLIDDSRSMAEPASATNTAPRITREADALKTAAALYPALNRRFQARLYTFDSGIHRLAGPQSLADVTPSASATRIGDALRQLLDQTSDLPLGGIVLLSDGADGPSAGIDNSTLAALASRRIAVQTIGFGAPAPSRDVEIDDAVLPDRALVKSRLRAAVSFHQHGYTGSHAVLTVRSGSALLASAPVTFARDGDEQTADLMFNAGLAGARPLQFTISTLPGETNLANNRLTRILDVTASAVRILYIEGEPRWEYKFIRRAESDDPQVQLVSMLRATENKIYRQGISDPSELAAGFPTRPEDLFRYQGLIIGSVQAAYFSPVQQDLINAFVNRRGGGVLFMAGQYALGDGGWAESSLAPLLPVTLPSHSDTTTKTFVRADLSTPNAPQAHALLAPAGADSVVTRLIDDPTANARKWQQLPWLMDYQDVGAPKPGAAVLADVRSPQGRVSPLLVTERYGLGRTAVLASSGTWRWQMNLPLGDDTYNLFWQQLLRWIAASSPGPVSASVPAHMLYDDGHLRLAAEVRDPQYNPAPGAQVEARILGPGGIAATLPLRPVPGSPGEFAADYDASQPGVYVANIDAPGFGQDSVAFDRQDGVAENFHTSLDRDLLGRLSAQTGGRYWPAAETAQLANQIRFSNAGVAMRDTLPLWNLPALFLLLLLLPLGQWFLRRRWGVV